MNRSSNESRNRQKAVCLLSLSLYLTAHCFCGRGGKPREFYVDASGVQWMEKNWLICLAVLVFETQNKSLSVMITFLCVNTFFQ